jgi:tetratricopeptide (TPR) repeat protein
MLEEKAPELAKRFSTEFWVPVGIVLGGIVLVTVIVTSRRAPEPPRKLPVASAEEVADAGAPQPTRGPPSDEARDVPPPREEPTPKPAHPRPRRARAPRAPLPPGPRDAPLPPPAPAEPPSPRETTAPEPAPGKPRELKSDLFGYGLRLPNESAWRMGFAGLSRHVLVRRDLTARLHTWAEVFTSPASAEACLRRHLGRLRRRFSRGALRVRSAPVRQRRGQGGLVLWTSEREAQGTGPRRDAGKYLVAFAADGPVCYGYEGFAGVPASRAARREVRTAFETFDVDPAVRKNAPTSEVRGHLERVAAPAEQSGNGALLLDIGTAWAALWPGEARGWHLLGVAHLLAERPHEALGALQSALRASAGSSTEEDRLRRFGLWTLVADASARLKGWPKATDALEEARKLLPDHPGLAYTRGCVQAMRGEIDKAIDSLEASFRSWPAAAAPPRIPHGLGAQVAIARRDARLKNLRKEPRFEILLRRFEARARKAQ